MEFKELQKKVLDWADGHDLLHEENSDKQFLKFIEEVFEFRDASTLYSYEYNGLDSEFGSYGEIQSDGYLQTLKEDLMLEMGDIIVTLIILCEQIGIDLEECLELAYEKIKDRKGKTIDGTFVKEEDLPGKVD